MLNSVARFIVIFALTIGSSAQAGMKFPVDFDNKNVYPETSYSDLFEYVKLTRGTTNEYIGKRFKLFVRVPLIPFGNISPMFSRMPMPAYVDWYKSAFLPKVDAPDCKICDLTWPVMDPTNATTSDMVDATWQNFAIYISLKDAKALKEFTVAIRRCVLDEDGKIAHFGCYGVIAGTMGGEVVDFKSSQRPFGPGSGKSTIPYMKIDKMELYRDEDEGKRQMEKIGNLYVWAGKTLVRVFKSTD